MQDVAQNTFKVTFTIDLAPYAAGLKSMLTMTGQAGQQLKPLLAGEAVPDMKPIEAELQRIEQQMKAVGIEAQITGQQMQGMGAPLDTIAGKSQKNTVVNAAHEGSIRGVRREASHMMMAMSFLAMSLGSTGDATEGGDKKTKLFTGTLKEGAMSGFGFATMLTMIGVESGGVALGLGAAVGVGAGLLKFFDDSEEKARRATQEFELFKNSLRGFSLDDLKKHRDAVSKALIELRKLQADQEKQKDSTYLSGIKGFGDNPWKAIQTLWAGYETAGDADKTKEQGDKLQTHIEEDNKQIAAKSLAGMEPKNKRREMEIQAEQDKYKKLRLEADKDFNDNIIALKGHDDLIELEEKIHANKLREIDDEEAQQKYDMKKAEIENAQNAADTVRKLELDTAKIIIDTNEQKELSAAKTDKFNADAELKRIETERKYAKEKLAIDEQEEKRVVQNQIDMAHALGGIGPTGMEGQFDLINKKYAAQRSAIDQKAINQTNEYYANYEERERKAQELWMRDHRNQVTMQDAMIDGVISGFDRLFDTGREAANFFDGIWLAVKRSGVSAFESILASEWKLLTVKQGMAEGDTAGSSGGGLLDSIFSVGKAALSIFGFADGGVFEPNQRGYIEGGQHEIIAPKSKFIDVARNDIVPAVLNAQGAGRTGSTAGNNLGGSSGATAIAGHVAKAVRDVIASGKWEMKIKDGDLYAVWNIANKKNDLKKL
jgi:hypothetical protein